ncbi:guanine nucleotide-binding protein subunit alpha [Mucor velutinosus]|uniref:Guanine nucleotide-binding protein subunit alpha n=1 Tax=Mucor velutinosus TaxID=708070 RepID=A0AAN7DQR7_9FUNG|nr:guanine nucleotide-binding protein subunit alpha [Mucor velutinosus]
MSSIQADTDTDLIQQLELQIRNLLSKDELLADVPSYATVEELEALLSIEKGQAYNISIERQPLPSIDIIVRQSSTVRDIKRMIKLHVNRQSMRKQISWRYIWRSHCLEFQGTKLLNDDAVVSQLGIKQHSVLKFARLPHEKGQHRKAWKHRP